MQNRQIWHQLESEIPSDEVVLITGPRQTGKTTTLKWLLSQVKTKNKAYFDLENIVTRELFEIKNYDLILNELQNRGLQTDQRLYLAIDEIQLLPSLPSLVKYLYDHYKIKFFLSGSSSFYIKNRFNESMAGRKLIFEMLPLTFQEFLDFQDAGYSLPQIEPSQLVFDRSLFQSLQSYYQEYLEYGGLPKVVLTPEISRKKQLLEEIFSSYINLDVQFMADFKSTLGLRSVIKLLASRVGTPLNLSELSSITGLNRLTIASYLEFLEQTYLIGTIPAFSKSLGVQTRLRKKVYFVDTGIANINADLSSGSKFENSIFCQLRSWGKLSYYSDKQGEIDFILTNQSGKTAFEVKETPTPADLRTLQRRAATIGLSESRLLGKNVPAHFTDFVWGGAIY